MIDTRAGYMHLHEDQQNEPGVTPTTLSVADVTLSTLKGVQQTYPLTRSGLTRLASSASWFKGGWWGSHSFKGGGEWAIASTSANTNAPQGINVFYNNNVPYQVRVYNTPIVSESVFHMYALFLQDAWTIDRKVTVSVGTRSTTSAPTIPLNVVRGRRSIRFSRHAVSRKALSGRCGPSL